MFLWKFWQDQSRAEKNKFKEHEIQILLYLFMFVISVRLYEFLLQVVWSFCYSIFMGYHLWYAVLASAGPLFRLLFCFLLHLFNHFLTVCVS